MDEFAALEKNFMCSDSEIEAFFAATSNENIENDVSLKKELILIDDHEPETDVPKPMKGLYEEGPTPFLKKTYAMVDDSQTDPIISWSETEMSFVIWDHHKFSADILPKHFKHCNFSSFIRQLNTYGFKKLSPDRWEYAVEGFQKGKDYLLKNIKRRRHQSDHHVLRDEKSSQLSFHCERLKKEAEVEQLVSDTDKLRLELMNIQKEQETADNYLLSVKERLRRTEHKQQQLFIYMAQAFKNPLFNEIHLQQLRSKEALDTTGISKKQKLIAPLCNKDPVEASYYLGRSQAKDGFATEIQKEFSSNETRSPVVQGQKVNEVFATKPSAIGSDKCLLLENLLADDVVSETKAAKEHANIQSKIFRELEELITKANSNWDVSMKEMVEQAVCQQSQF
ncbi:Heat shock transcription factor A2 [Heracleum sosnowskyi]|uniref:Heat shock transcription factor A2 n=1 Tax=Heracleum sosnowskyi TaxID=360622 RepID=A0AAD8I591_9APIA|nr:Heat shock transcription factor A2 [Heracleum sosnowskyi]